MVGVPGTAGSDCTRAMRTANRWRLAAIVFFSPAAAILAGIVYISLGVGFLHTPVQFAGGMLAIALPLIPVLLAAFRWDRAFSVAILLGSLLSIVTVVVRFSLRRADAPLVESYSDMITLVFAGIFLTGGLRTLRAARTLRMSGLSDRPRRRWILELSVLGLSLALGASAAWAIRPRVESEIRKRQELACARNLLSILNAIRDYEAANGTRPPSLDVLVSEGRIESEGLRCSVQRVGGETFPYQYHPEAIGLSDILVCDSQSPHGTRLGVFAIRPDGDLYFTSREAADARIERVRNYRLDGAVGAARRSINRQRAALQAIYAMRMVEFDNAGGLEGGTLTPREAFNERRRLLESAISAHAQVLVYVRGEPASLREQLTASELNPAALQSAIDGDAERHRATLEFVEAEEKLHAVFNEYLNFLDERWGQWEYDGDEDMMRFEEDDAVEGYLDIIGRMRALAAEVQEKLAKSQELEDSVNGDGED